MTQTPDKSGKYAVIAILCLVNLAIGCAYLSRLRSRPVWDLPQFYFAGKLVREGRVASLYDRSAYGPLIQELRQMDSPAADGAAYFNRPAYDAILCLPLAWLPFRAVRALALAGNLALLAFLVWKLPSWARAPGLTRVGLFIFMPFLHTIAFGQDTILLTLMIGYAVYLIVEGRDAPAGILFAAAAFKPHLIWAIPIALLAGRKWKALRAFTVTGACLGALSLALVGRQGFHQWIQLLQAPSTDAVPHWMGNVRALAINLTPVIAVAVAVASASAFIIVLRYRCLLDKLMAAIIIALLVSPHTYLQDYCLLSVVALFTGSRFWLYVTLIPWPYFTPGQNMVPLTLFAVVFLIALAVPGLLHPSRTRGCAEEGHPDLIPACEDS